MRCGSPASSRTPRSELDDLLLALRVAVSLAAVLGALWYLQRRLTRGGALARRRRDEGIAVVARQALGGKAQLVVVEVDGSRYVLGVSEQGVSVIDRTRAPQPLDGAPRTGSEPAADAADVVTGFEKLLAAAADGEPSAVTVTPAEGDPAAPLRRDRRTARAAVSDPRAADPLQGSILSPSTWRQTAQALRRAR
jgi:flagellar protein FliO/FliZ